jgi:hypothetical protein
VRADGDPVAGAERGGHLAVEDESGAACRGLLGGVAGKGIAIVGLDDLEFDGG